MSSIQNTPTPLGDQPGSAIQRGLLGLLAKPGDKSTGGAESFSREVERAVARQGGKQALEERRLQQSSSRRSKRHSSFGGSTDAAAEAAPRRRGQETEVPEELVPIERQVQPSENRRAAQPRVQDGGRAPAPTGSPATSASERAPQAPAQGPATAASPSESGHEWGAQAAPGVTQVLSGAAGAPAAVAGSSSVQPAAGARPLDASQAFVDAAKGKGLGTAAPKAAAPTGSTPDPKMLEHAEKVLRQIRVHLRPGMKSMTLNLNPLDLGRLSIDLSVQKSGLTAVVRAESAETLELLKHQAPELRAVLAQRGIETEQMEFKLAFDVGGSQQDETFKQSSDGRKSKGTSPQNESLSTTSSPSSSIPKSRDDGGIDTLA